MNAILNLQTELQRVEASLKNELVTNRMELTEGGRSTRAELFNSIQSFESKLTNLISTVDLKLKEANESNNINASANRTETKEALLAQPDLYVADPRAYRGRWREFFVNDQPLHLELGMGKGRFISEMSGLHPQINFIGIDMKEELLMQAIEESPHAVKITRIPSSHER